MHAFLMTTAIFTPLFYDQNFLLEIKKKRSRNYIVKDK